MLSLGNKKEYKNIQRWVQTWISLWLMPRLERTRIPPFKLPYARMSHVNSPKLTIYARRHLPISKQMSKISLPILPLRRWTSFPTETKLPSIPYQQRRSTKPIVFLPTLVYGSNVFGLFKNTKSWTTSSVTISICRLGYLWLRPLKYTNYWSKFGFSFLKSAFKRCCSARLIEWLF